MIFHHPAEITAADLFGGLSNRGTRPVLAGIHRFIRTFGTLFRITAGRIFAGNFPARAHFADFPGLCPGFCVFVMLSYYLLFG
jgi:hypothetical protein